MRMGFLFVYLFTYPKEEDENFSRTKIHIDTHTHTRSLRNQREWQKRRERERQRGRKRKRAKDRERETNWKSTQFMRHTMMWLCTHSKKKQLRRKTHTQISMPDWVHNCCYPSTIIFVLLLCVVRVRNEQFSIFSLLIPSSSLVLIHSLSLTRSWFDICLVFECVFFRYWVSLHALHSLLCRVWTMSTLLSHFLAVALRG